MDTRTTERAVSYSRESEYKAALETVRVMLDHGLIEQAQRRCVSVLESPMTASEEDA